MKKNKLMTIAFVAISSISGQLFAQDAAAVKPGYNVKANVKCRVAATPEGCSFTFQKIEMDAKSQAPRDVATGQSSGKRQHGVIKCYEVSSSDNSLYEVKSPRDVATGQASGKRTAESTQDSSSGMSAGKVSYQDLHFVLHNSKGAKVSNLTVTDEDCDISSDLPDGEYTLIASWSWGMSQSGGMSSGGSGGRSGKCSVAFSLTYENGTCMAINEKGLPGEKGTKKGTK